MTTSTPTDGQPTLSHLDERGAARMVDVSDKPESHREATARGRVVMRAETLALITEGRVSKGDVLATARLAGIMAAKRTHDLIPLCHPLPISGAEGAGPAVEIEAVVRWWLEGDRETPPALPLLEGWRGALAGDAILAWLGGKAALVADPDSEAGVRLEPRAPR